VDDALRLETTATIARPGVRVLPDQVALENFHNWSSGVTNSPKLSPDGKYLAITLQDKKTPSLPAGIKVVEWPSGKPLSTRSGSYLPIAFRPGTTQLAMANWGGVGSGGLSLWDASTDKEIAKYTGLNAAFSTDGSYLLTHDGQANKKIPVQIWDLTSGQEVKQPDPSMFQAFLSGHEALLLHEDRYHVWDCRAGRERMVTPKGLKALGCSAQAKLGALRGRLTDEPQESLHVWDLTADRRVGVITGLSEFPEAVEISPDGHYLLFNDPAARGESLRVWDLRAGRFSSRLMPPRGFECVTPPPHGTLGSSPGDRLGHLRSFNPDGSLLASLVYGEQKSFLCVWDTASGDVLATVPNVTGPGWTGHGWSGDGRRLFMGGSTGKGFEEKKYIGWWEATPPPPSYMLGTPIKSLSLNKDGSQLAVNDMICTMVQEEHGQELVSWETPAKGLIPQFVGKDEVWVVGAREATVQAPRIQTELWQLAPNRRMLVVPEPQNPEAQKLADNLTNRQTSPQIGAMSTVGLLGSPSGKAPLLAASALFPGRTQPFYVLVGTERWAISPEGHLFFRKVGFGTVLFSTRGFITSRTGAPGKVSELWDYQKMKRLALSNEWMDCIQFSPDGRRAATDTEFQIWSAIGGKGPGLRIWNAATGEIEKVLPSEGSQALDFTGDSRRLMAVKVGGTARLFDVETGRVVQTWKAGNEDWQAFSQNQDGALVASGGEDKMIHLWDAATGREVARWQGHNSGVTALLFSRDGQILYSGSSDGTLKLWNLPAIRKELAALGLDW